MLRETIKGIAKNTSVMFLQQIVTWSSTFLLLLFLPRYLGPVEYGRLFLVISISGIFLILVNYGGTLVIAKKVSRAKESTAQILVDALGLRFLLWIVSFAGIVAFSHIFTYPDEVTTMLLIAGVGLLWDCTTTCLYACYQGNELLKYTSLGVIAKRVFISLVGIIVLLLGVKAIGIILVLVLGSVTNVLVLVRFRKKIITRLPKINWPDAKNQLKEGLPYFLLLAFGTIYYRIDSIMLSKMTPETVVGWYGAAYRLFDSLSFFPHLVTVALYPVLSRLWKGEEQTHRRTVQKSLEYIIIIGVPMSVAVVAFSSNIVQLFFGLDGYEQSVFVLQMLTAGLLLLFVDMVLGTTLLSSDKQQQQSLVALSAIPVNVGLNYVLIPRWQVVLGNGGVGAAIATVVTEFYIMIALLYLMPQGLLRGFRVSVLVKSSVAALCMVLSIWLMSQTAAWFLTALISLVIYFVVLFLMKTLEPEEREFLKNLVRIQRLRDLKKVLTSGNPSEKE